jgi:hypothetical protein
MGEAKTYFKGGKGQTGHFTQVCQSVVYDSRSNDTPRSSGRAAERSPAPSAPAPRARSTTQWRASSTFAGISSPATCTANTSRTSGAGAAKFDLFNAQNVGRWRRQFRPLHREGLAPSPSLFTVALQRVWQAMYFAVTTAVLARAVLSVFWNSSACNSVARAARPSILSPRQSEDAISLPVIERPPLAKFALLRPSPWTQP